MFKITEQNYDYYKKIFTILIEFEAPHLNIDLAAIHSPIKILAARESQDMKLAIKGLKEGLRECLSFAKDLSKKTIEELDAVLASEGLPSFKRLSAAIHNTVAKVLKRGKISHIEEYYIVKESIADSKNHFSESDRDRLEEICLAFESNSRNQKRRRR
jgi:hypothetical protein